MPLSQRGRQLFTVVGYVLPALTTVSFIGGCVIMSKVNKDLLGEASLGFQSVCVSVTEIELILYLVSKILFVATGHATSKYFVSLKSIKFR